MVPLFKKNEIKTWLLLFAKHVGDKPSNELATVLPYRQILPIWQEYTDDLTTAQFVYGEPAKISHFHSVFNKVSVNIYSEILAHLLLAVFVLPTTTGSEKLQVMQKENS